MTDDYISSPRNRQIAQLTKDLGWIEKYGSGIKRVLKLFGEYGLPKPEFQIQQGGFWVKINSTPQITPQITPRILWPTGLKGKIIEVIRTNPAVSHTGIAVALNISKNTAKEYLTKLKNEGYINRIGPDKGGHWEVIK